MTTGVCKWCGSEFNKNHNREMYCSGEHRRYARQEQKLEYSRRYRKLYKDTFSENQKYGLGSGGLGAHRKEDFDSELNLIENEMKRLNIF
ncbi:MAG: hypothetical protein ACRC1M_05815 [Methanobacteriaceae archaeon]